MTVAITFAPQDVISIVNNEPRTTSLKVAEVFGKLHKNVMQKIENLDCSSEFASANFSANARLEQIGGGAQREFKYYEMTKDGFMFLVMGFTGKKAAQIKEAYINAFNWMAAQLFAKPVAPKTSADERSPLRAAVSLLVGKRSLMYPEAYALVHQRFGVEHIDQLTPDQATQAVEYVHRLVLDGEILPADRPEKGAVWLTEAEAFNLAGLLWILPRFKDVQKEAEQVLRAAQSPLAARMFDAWHEPILFYGSLDSLRSRCEAVKKSMAARHFVCS
ncbi:Rha family transcriptional regulator [Laribacter hongkongensis]|nr:Rha family transcriptional regulator [Laribacter hongkongensis]MCG9101588.1 Rha family transcriptional regulator [Laribacter hongkongensis]MCG9104286.1 Rha family transcriptional regulator [Laribacter hongkongensis]MCG9113519.1 Rha family transcriptional regulator [Laribacter hongkongensis]MCG9119257.1 Rha family transcriptional regulator [Laribacter hongkongensis]